MLSVFEVNSSGLQKYLTTENDGSFAPSVKVLIFPEAGRIFWNFFLELIDVIEFCLLSKLIQVGCRNIWRRRTTEASLPVSMC